MSGYVATTLPHFLAFGGPANREVGAVLEEFGWGARYTTEIPGSVDSVR